MIQAEQLFLQARIDLAAELVAIGVASSNAQGYEWLGSRLEWFEFVFRFSRKQDDEEDADAHLFEEEWAGRALDQERRTKQAVQDSKNILLSRMEESFKESEEAQAALIQRSLADFESRILNAISNK